MFQMRVKVVMNLFGLVLLSLSVGLPDVFLDGDHLEMVNGFFRILCYYQSCKWCCQALRGQKGIGRFFCWIHYAQTTEPNWEGKEVSF